MVTFGDVRALLSERPALERWTRLTRWIDQALERRPEETAEVWLPYIRERLVREWPLYLCVTPKRWQEALCATDAPHPLAEVALHVTFSNERHHIHMLHRPRDGAVVRFLLGPNARHVRRLALGLGAGFSVWHALAGGARLPALRELSITQSLVRTEHLRAMLAAPALRRLRVLVLCDVGLRDAGVAALLRAPLIETLEELELASNALSTGAAEALASASSLRRLHTLDLSDNHIDSEGAAAFARTTLPALHTLLLNENSVEADGAAALADAAGRLEWRELGLHENPVGREGAQAMIDAGLEDSIDAEWLERYYNVISPARHL